MSVLQVLIHPDPLLIQPTQTVTHFNHDLEALIQDMFDTMKHYNGIGLAAPQVGILEKVIVLQFENRKMALINPEITAQSGVAVAEEGCLSLPNTLVKVERAETITVKAQTPQGKLIERQEKDWIARIIQHEIDHLNGILIIDKPYKEQAC